MTKRDKRLELTWEKWRLESVLGSSWLAQEGSWSSGRPDGRVVEVNRSNQQGFHDSLFIWQKNLRVTLLVWRRIPVWPNLRKVRFFIPFSICSGSSLLPWRKFQIDKFPIRLNPFQSEVYIRSNQFHSEISEWIRGNRRNIIPMKPSQSEVCMKIPIRMNPCQSKVCVKIPIRINPKSA